MPGSSAATPVGAGVRAVGGAEGVVDVDVGERGEVARRAPGRSWSPPARSARSRAAARRPSPSALRHRLDLVADHGRRQLHRRAEQLGEALADRRQSRAPASTLPFGRPRCETSTSEAPRSRSGSIVGSAARMRVSSATRPPSSGTLKSTRTSTRLPADLGVADAGLGEASSADDRSAALRGPCRPARRSGWSSPTRCRTRRRP